jgi:hypothetical protein
MLKLDPMRTKDRIDIEEPMCKKSNTLKLLPNFTQPYMEVEDPRRTIDRRDMVEPRAK